MKCRSCFMKCKVVNDKECVWNGCMFSERNYIITTVAPLLMTLSCKNLKKTLDQNLNNLSTYLVRVDAGVQKRSSSQLLENFVAEPILAWKSRKFSRSLERVKFSSGMMSDPASGDSDEASACCALHGDDQLLAWYALFSTTPTVTFDPSLLPDTCCNLQQGMSVWTSSYPFGDSNHVAFHNCVSRGVLCNVMDDALLLIDACCLPGSQGACVYGNGKKTDLLGIVLCQLELRTGQLAGMAIVCSWKEIRQSLLSQCYKSQSLRFSLVAQKIPEKVKCSPKNVEVVTLRHYKGWGSGVIVAVDTERNRIFIATCRHVVEPATSKIMQATFFSGSKQCIVLSAKVVYVTSKDSWLDFSLLQVTCDHTIVSAICRQMSDCLVVKDDIHVLKYALNYDKGVPVFAKGHCLFDNSHFLPTVTKGEISSVVFPSGGHFEESRFPILLHSNCTVLDGASGGGLFSCRDWTFYGLLVNNVKEYFDEKRHVLFQRVNFVLPAALFMPAVLSHISNSSDFSSIDRISLDLSVKKLWLLHSPDNSCSTCCKSKL